LEAPWDHKTPTSWLSGFTATAASTLAPEHLDDDQLARLAEEERVAAGLDHLRP
jgi:hypothetical protein